VAFLGLTYIIWGFGFLTLLRQIDNGVYLYLLPFLGAWVSDSFAYFTGRLFGRHKLIPDVSPKKTVEGAIGGVVFAMLSFMLYGFIVSKIGGGIPNYIILGLMGLPVSLVSIIGDLIMSLIKRRYGVKDYGKLFPGHGGVLDRFDSVLATSIAMYLLCANIVLFSPLF
ncbi:MAG: phosphatidate cytidylyltransferase, partial [Eubacteriales bacterium]